MDMRRLEDIEEIVSLEVSLDRERDVMEKIDSAK